MQQVFLTNCFDIPGNAHVYTAGPYGCSGSGISNPNRNFEYGSREAALPEFRIWRLPEFRSNDSYKKTNTSVCSFVSFKSHSRRNRLHQQSFGPTHRAPCACIR
jgi:hypothetical protein